MKDVFSGMSRYKKLQSTSYFLLKINDVTSIQEEGGQQFCDSLSSKKNWQWVRWFHKLSIIAGRHFWMIPFPQVANGYELNIAMTKIIFVGFLKFFLIFKLYLRRLRSCFSFQFGFFQSFLETNNFSRVNSFNVFD